MTTVEAKQSVSSIPIEELYPQLKELKRRFPQLKEINREDQIPERVLIIPDRNRTYAFSLSKPASYGHAIGAQTLRNALFTFFAFPIIEEVNVWALSEDNLDQRKPKEKEDLHKIEAGMIRKNINKLKESGIRFTTEGRKDRLPQNYLDAIDEAKRATAANSGKILRLLIDYGETYRENEHDLRVAQATVDQNLPKGTIVTPELLAQIKRPLIEPIPPVDLVIRTVGKREAEEQNVFWESRLGQIVSGAVWVFVPKTLPEATNDDFANCLATYAKTEKRKGGDSKVQKLQQ